MCTVQTPHNKNIFSVFPTLKKLSEERIINGLTLPPLPLQRFLQNQWGLLAFPNFFPGSLKWVLLGVAV